MITAVGALSAANTPSFDGVESFRGASYHTGRWPHEGVDFSGLRVGVIGTGASAVQAIPLIAQEASDLTVFQRTANYIVPANNGPVPPETVAARKADYDNIWQRVRESNFGFELYFLEKGALDVSDEELERELMARWEAGGFGIWLGAYADIFFVDEANAKVRAFLHDRIREKVSDPETAELLIPKGYPFGVKRNPLDSGYYETFNLDHVHLVDVKANPIAAITEEGVRLEDGTAYAFDAIVYATGFDAMTGPMNKIDIRGRGGRLLREKWAEGPRTYLGLTSAGFPNLFTITGPQSPSVLSNMPVSIEQHVEFIGRIIGDVDERGAATIEATPEAEEEWVAHNQELANGTLFPTADTWYMGANIPGKPRVFMPNLDFVGPVPGEVRRHRRQRLPGVRLLRERGQGARLTAARRGSGSRRVGARGAPGRRVRQDDPQARDARAVDLGDPELDVGRDQLVAHDGPPPEVREDEPGEGSRALLRQLGAHRLVEVVDRQGAGHRERAVVDPGDGRVREVVLVLDLADDLLEDVLDRDDALGAAVLVDDDGERLVRLPQLAQEDAEVLRLRNHVRRAGERRDRGRRVAVRGGDEVAQADHADEPVDRSPADEQPAVRRSRAPARGRCAGRGRRRARRCRAPGP